MNVKHIEEGNIPIELYNTTVIIFGAGHTGKVVYDILHSNRMPIHEFVDDFQGIQGKKINGINVISFDDFCCKYNDCNVSIVLGTIYAKAIFRDRMEKLRNVTIYELYNWYCRVDGTSVFSSIVEEDNEKKELFYDELKRVSDKMDSQSVRTVKTLIECVKKKDISDISIVCSEEDQYFPHEVIEALPSEINIIDAGAYHGELGMFFERHSVQNGKWYCFEADKENYDEMEKMSHDGGYGGVQQICINKGLWSEAGKLFFSGNLGAASRIVDYETDSSIETITIDEYMREYNCNFIKMDIEGAEYNALLGGIKTIKRDRPILAISIYHSLEDFYRIPELLMNELNDYHFLIRHHSMIFSETVLYGIPYER